MRWAWFTPGSGDAEHMQAEAAVIQSLVAGGEQITLFVPAMYYHPAAETPSNISCRPLPVAVGDANQLPTEAAEADVAIYRWHSSAKQADIIAAWALRRPGLVILDSTSFATTPPGPLAAAVRSAAGVLATDNAVAQQSRDWGATLIETLPWPDAVSDNQSPRQQLQKMPLNSWTESTNFPRASTQDFACRLTSLAERVVGRLPPCSLADVVAARLRELGARAGDPVVARVAAEIAAWCEPARDAA